MVLQPAKSSGRAVAAIAVAAAMLLGGSGSLVPVPEIVLECLLAGLTALWVWLRPDGLRHVPRSAWIIAAAMLAVPLLQLLPMPPGLWQSLPGRSVERAALDLVGRGTSWQPLSLTPNRTVASFLAMAAAAAVLVMAAAQDRKGRALLIVTIAAMALLSVLVGAAQLSGGAGNSFRFYNPEEAFLDGFQTNHNAAADVLLIGMVTLAAAICELLARRRETEPRSILGMAGGATLLLMLGVILTGSRTGIALLPIAIAAQAIILRRWLRLGLRRWLRLGLRLGLRLDKRRAAMVTVPVLALALALAVLIIGAAAWGHHGALGRVRDRFHTPTEFRPEIWRDALFALRQYWPWGSGMGSFIPVFAAAERLEVVTGKFVNRAHDDYLEFLIEAGLPGVVALGLICWQIAQNAWRGRSRGRHARPAGPTAQRVCGAANLFILALHSLGDYPLRTVSIACITAVSAGLLLPLANGAGRGLEKNGDER